MSVPLDVPGTTKGIAEVEAAHGNFIISWVPGNGTHYRIGFVPLEPHMVKAAGFDMTNKAYLVTWLLPGESCRSYVFQEEGYLAYSYVLEKLCHGKGSAVDASELTRIIGLVLKRDTMLCTDENGHGTE